MADFVLTRLRWNSFTVDPEVSNARGVNFWSKVGFVPVRVVGDGLKPPYWHMEWPITQ